MRSRLRLIIMLILIAFVPPIAPTCSAQDTPEQQARQILGSSGLAGGLIVHIDCNDGKLTTAMGADDRFIVHGLDTDADDVERSRRWIASCGLSGRLSVDHFDGRRLPHIDNLANLVVADDLGGVPMAEVMRVLAPNGVVCVRQGGWWAKATKPWPEDIDEWTHYLHDPQGTMTAADKAVSLPRRTQWVAGPKWLRNHDFMSSLTALVSANGRIFYIIDEGLRNHIYLPTRWTLIARDAFNGAQLWKVPVKDWFPHTIPFKSGPGHQPRRLVAVDDTVYATLGINAPVSALDGATGKNIRTYEQTKGAGEIVVSDGVIYVVKPATRSFKSYKHASANRGAERNRVNSEFGWSKDSPASLAMAVDAGTGKVLWEHTDRIAPLTLAVKDERIVFHDGERIVALNRDTGKPLWTSEPLSQWAVPATGYAARLIAGDGVVILSAQRGKGGRLFGVSAETGKTLWKTEQPNSGHFSPEDLFLINDLVWTVQTGKVQTQGTLFKAVNAKTGEIAHDFTAENLEVFFMHQRCYPGKATERFIMASGTGTEFLEVGTEHCELHHWLRGSCIYGIMPANGMLYKTPDSCACFYQSKLPHFCAIAPAGRQARANTEQDRLEKGLAFGSVKTVSIAADAWPAYRRDNARSGAAPESLSPELERKWQTELGGRLSTITAAHGKLFLSDIDRHRVYALSAETGKELWSFDTSGRVDSPPTIWNNLAIFGCADGWVYALNIDDGRLAWRFLAAPGPDRLLSYEQIESVWPVHGSVLIHDDIAYALAGRNMFLDGGMRLARLDCASGKLLSETILDDKDPVTGKNLQTLIAGKAMPVANAGLLSFDGRYIYMGTQKFGLNGKRVGLAPVLGKEGQQAGPGRHLFCPTGFLDEVWFHRSYWIYGLNAGEGHGEYFIPRRFAPSGRIMVFDDANVYASMAQNLGNNINPRTSYTLYAAAKGATAPPAPAAPAPATRKGKRAKPAVSGKGIDYLWRIDKPAPLVNAMVLAGRNLFLAGAPDVADEEKTFDYVYDADDQIHREMREQEQAFLGKQGALLWVVSADTGRHLKQYEMPAIPVWDGMISAGGRLYASLKDGTVICMAPKK